MSKQPKEPGFGGQYRWMKLLLGFPKIKPYLLFEIVLKGEYAEFIFQNCLPKPTQK